MSFYLKRIFGKSVLESEKTVEQSPQFRKSLRERLEAARLVGNNVERVSGHNSLYHC